MSKKILLGAVVIAIITYNLYDFIKVKNHTEEANLKRCMDQFIQNTKVTESIARKYCDCAIESLASKYEGTTLSSSEIKEKERTALQSCYEQAVASEELNRTE